MARKTKTIPVTLTKTLFRRVGALRTLTASLDIPTGVALDADRLRFRLTPEIADALDLVLRAVVDGRSSCATPHRDRDLTVGDMIDAASALFELDRNRLAKASTVLCPACRQWIPTEDVGDFVPAHRDPELTSVVDDPDDPLTRCVGTGCDADARRRILPNEVEAFAEFERVAVDPDDPSAGFEYLQRPPEP